MWTRGYGFQVNRHLNPTNSVKVYYFQKFPENLISFGGFSTFKKFGKEQRLNCYKSIFSKEFTPRRLFSLGQDQQRKEIDKITEKYAEARELIGDARDSFGTTYFDDDFGDAEDVVNEVIADYEFLLTKLDETAKHDVQLMIGMRIQELKQEIKQLRSKLHEE